MLSLSAKILLIFRNQNLPSILDRFLHEKHQKAMCCLAIEYSAAQRIDETAAATVDRGIRRIDLSVLKRPVGCVDSQCANAQTPKVAKRCGSDLFESISHEVHLFQRTRAIL